MNLKKKAGIGDFEETIKNPNETKLKSTSVDLTKVRANINASPIDINKTKVGTKNTTLDTFFKIGKVNNVNSNNNTKAKDNTAKHNETKKNKDNIKEDLIMNTLEVSNHNEYPIENHTNENANNISYSNISFENNDNTNDETAIITKDNILDINIHDANSKRKRVDIDIDEDKINRNVLINYKVKK